MKITEVEALYLRLPEIQARTDSSQDALIVKVATDAGITGWGEVDGCPYVTKAIIEAPMSHTLVTGLRELLIGEDPLEIARLWRKMYQGTLYYGREGAVIQAYDRWAKRIPTAALNRWLAAAIERNPPPMVQGRRLKIRYATQARTRPPTFALFANKPGERMPDSYVRYLDAGLRKEFGLEGVPLRFFVRHGDNPFDRD